VVLGDSLYNGRPFFRRDTVLNFLWAWTVLGLNDRRDTSQQFFEFDEALVELSMRKNEVD
jgi:hypothetical protein